MPKDVEYNKEADADAYAAEVSGRVIGRDTTGYGVPDTWTVVQEMQKGDVLMDDSDAAITSAPKTPTYAEVVEALGMASTWNDKENPQTPYDRKHSKEVLKNATDEQKAKARRELDIGMNIGGVVDELGYMHGGMPHGKRDPIKYASGGAVRGKRFVGTF
jgi:hypothetical protein